MEFLRRLLGLPTQQTTKEQVQHTRDVIHEDKNQFQREMIQFEKRLDRSAREAIKMQEEFKKSVAYKIAVATGGTKRGLL